LRDNGGKSIKMKSGGMGHCRIRIGCVELY